MTLRLRAWRPRRLLKNSAVQGKGKEGEKTGALDIDAVFGEDAGDF